jgi:hypothetical protein
MYDEVSQRTPALNALQLEITDIFSNTYRITIAYRPSKQIQLQCSELANPICLNTFGAFVSCATIVFQHCSNAMKLFALQ